MLERLFNLLQSKSFEDEMASMFDNVKLIAPFWGVSTFNNVSNFALKDGVYELSMDVDDNATADNVEINLDKKNVLSIKYSVKTVSSERMVSVRESLPEDCDSDTLDASIKNGKLVVTVNQK